MKGVQIHALLPDPLDERESRRRLIFFHIRVINGREYAYHKHIIAMGILGNLDYMKPKE